MKSWPVIAAVLALGACQDPAPRSPPGSSDPPGTKATQAVGPRTVTAAQVGPITARTRFDREAIARLFPGAEVVEQTMMESPDVANKVAVMQVSFDGATQLYIRKRGNDLRVDVVGPAFATPEGRRVGQTLAEARLTSADCRPKGEGREISQTVTCGPEGANPEILFRTPTYNYGGGVEPRPNYDQARLAAMAWRRPT